MASRRRTPDDYDTDVRTRGYIRNFPNRALSWDYIEELEYLLDWHVGFESRLLTKLKKVK